MAKKRGEVRARQGKIGQDRTRWGKRREGRVKHTQRPNTGKKREQLREMEVFHATEAPLGGGHVRGGGEGGVLIGCLP